MGCHGPPIPEDELQRLREGVGTTHKLTSERLASLAKEIARLKAICKRNGFSIRVSRTGQWLVRSGKSSGDRREYLVFSLEELLKRL